MNFGERIVVGLITISILILTIFAVLRKPTTFQPQPAQVAQPQSQSRLVEVGPMIFLPQPWLDISRPENRAYLPTQVEFWQGNESFEIAADNENATPGTDMHWVQVIRKSDGIIFRALISKPDTFGAVVRGRAVRLGMVHFWENPASKSHIPIVMPME